MIQFESVEAVAELCKKESQEYVIYKSQVYDVAKFQAQHPGGKAIIQKDIGKVIDEPFDGENHSDKAKSYFGQRVPQVGFVLSDANREKLTMEIDTEYKKSWFCSRKYVIKKLFTNEDPIYLHKTLGLLALCSFIYRYFYVLPMTGTLGFDGTWFDYATLALHQLLSCSSLIFHVLPQRIIKRPLIIWNEYRAHAIVFTTRCISTALFAKHYSWGWQGGRYSAEVDHIILLCFVMAHHMAADEVTRRYGEVNMTTVRGTSTQDKDGKEKFSNHFPTGKQVTLMYAYAQFVSISCHILPSDRLMDYGYNLLVGIQSSTFLMTLFRKGLIRWQSHIFWYAFALVLLVGYAILTKDIWYWIKLTAVFYLRTNFRMSKYVVWGIFAIMSLPVIENILFSHLNTYKGMTADMGFDSSAFNMFQVPSFGGTVNV